MSKKINADEEVDDMRRHMEILLHIALCLYALHASGQELMFKNHGKIVKKLSLGDLSKITPLSKVAVWDPNERDDVTYEGYLLTELFEKVYGESWSTSEEVLFTCLDGYRPSLPVKRFQTHKAFLAIRRTDKPEFSMVNQNEHGKTVNLAPLYLVWDNKTRSEIQSGDGNAWPYQVASIDLTTFAETFPRLAPGDKSSSSAKRGFLAFRQYCMGCHTLNGDGGKGGPELNYPINVTEYYKETWLKKWILDPTSIRFKTAMPGLPKDTRDREKTADEILSYFKAMKGHKVKPAKP